MPIHDPALPIKQLSALFKANPTLLAIEFAYRGRRGDGHITSITARSTDGLPIDLDDLRPVGKLTPHDQISDDLFTLVHALVPLWCIGLGSRGTGTIVRDGPTVVLRHAAYRKIADDAQITWPSRRA